MEESSLTRRVPAHSATTGAPDHRAATSTPPPKDRRPCDHRAGDQPRYHRACGGHVDVRSRKAAPDDRAGAGPHRRPRRRLRRPLAVDTLSTDEVAFMLAARSAGSPAQRSRRRRSGARCRSRPAPTAGRDDRPSARWSSTLDEFLASMRRRVDEGHVGLPPEVAVRGEILLMADAGLLPGLPAMVADGVHTVGADVPPGWYVIWNVAECSWAHLDSDGDVLDKNFVRRPREPRSTSLGATTRSDPSTAAAGSGSTKAGSRRGFRKCAVTSTRHLRAPPSPDLFTERRRGAARHRC